MAAKAGVSTATVSYVLNGTRGTREETRRRVMAAIEELGYSQNQAARDLARGRSSLLGLVVSDICNPFFPEITAAFQEQALLRNLDAVVVNTNYDATRTLHSVRRLLGLQVPGVALLTSQIDPAVMELLAERGVAAVYLDLGRVDRAISNIVIDYEQGIAQGPVRASGTTRTTGTKIHFLPDAEIFDTIEFDYDILEKRLRELAYLNRGVAIRLTDERGDERKEQEFFSSGGLAG